jgi:hypothetical protein
LLEAFDCDCSGFHLGLLSETRKTCSRWQHFALTFTFNLSFHFFHFVGGRITTKNDGRWCFYSKSLIRSFFPHLLTTMLLCKLNTLLINESRVFRSLGKIFVCLWMKIFVPKKTIFSFFCTVGLIEIFNTQKNNYFRIGKLIELIKLTAADKQ